MYPGGVLRTSSDGDDWMGAKIKTKKIPGPKINPKEIPCRISEPFKKTVAEKHVWFYVLLVERLSHGAGIRVHHHESSDCFEYPQKIVT